MPKTQYGMDLKNYVLHSSILLIAVVFCFRISVKLAVIEDNMKYPVIVFLLFFLLSGCTKDDNPLITNEPTGFGIYFLADSTIKIQDLLGKDISQLKLQSTPWISEKDIEFYDWSSHCIYLKKDKSSLFPNYFEGYYQLPLSWTDRPWVVVANSLPCYLGYFVTDASVITSPFPEITVLEVDTWGYPKDIITSGWIWLLHSDPRDNELAKESLIQSGLFHGGINVSMDFVNSRIKIFNSDTVTVEYSIRIKNNDTDDLFVFDPDKTGSDIYHYYNNGPNFIDMNGTKSYNSKYKKTKKPDSWDSNWYTLLKSGESIERTIRLKGYPSIPPGIYWVQLEYSVPKQGLDKNKRINQNGRYWIGSTITKPIQITY